MSKTVLIVEDDLIMQQVLNDIFETPEVLEDIFEIPEITVKMTAQGLEAISIVSEPSSTIDLAILDMGLPDINGMEALKRIRQILPNLPILVASGTESFTIMQKIKGMDKVHVLPKPYNVSHLIRAIKNILG